ncbi:MAG TPA: leucine-rich repeat-containing protein kinase family protein [Candidatus Microsaccharimonas sp.]|jgi:hypothetical protein
MTFEHIETSEVTPTYFFDESLKKLTVRGVKEFPQEVIDYGDRVEILDMSGNQLTSLPEALKELSNLRVAFFSGSKFREVPVQLAGCESLEMVGLKSCGVEELGDFVLPEKLKGLILTDNLLSKLPDSIGQYVYLQKLMLTGNQLETLPVTMSALKKLELLRVAGNKLGSAPSWVSELPSLSWYGDSDNTFNPASLSENIPVAEFGRNDILFGEKLGESSKNIVYAATLKSGQSVAVKMFGAGITTDGSADNETLVALIAGNHPHIVGALGRIANTPNEQQGLVMPLVSRDYVSLGYPPNFVEYTRDVYTYDTRFSESVIVNIATCVADALEHLHSRGIMHGDVYAHNVLYSPDGDAKLCDFGASSLYDRNSPSESWREKLDVGGYGHLIEELVQRSEQSEFPDGIINGLSELYAACIDENPATRPSFIEIKRQLQIIQS